MKYNFDEVIDRSGSNSMNTDGFREYIFHDTSLEFPFPDTEFTRMWIADMEFATPPEVVQGIQDRLNKRIFGYTKVFDPGYYEAFKNWCDAKYGWHCEKKDLVTSPGIIPALYELTGHICAEDEKVLILTPSYAYFKHAADFNHRELVCSDLINDKGYYTIDFADFETKAQDPKVRLMILSNPHNPSGRVWSWEELEKMGQICRENDVWIISDEIHCDLIRLGQKHIPMDKVMPDYEKLVTCMAPSKTFNMAGLMFSNIIIKDAGLMATWKDRHYDFENPLSIAGAQAAYEHGADWLEEMRAYLDENFRFTKAYLEEHLPKAIFRIPEATYLAWVDISAYLEPDVDIPMYFATKAKVLLEGGNMFVQNSDRYIRLNLACPRAMLETGLAKICSVLK